jgi:hypothetical protein
MSIFSTTPGYFLAAGIVFGAVAVLIGEGVQIPTANKLLSRAKEAKESGKNELSADDWTLVNRLKVWGVTGVVVVALAAMMMIAAAWA